MAAPLSSHSVRLFKEKLAQVVERTPLEDWGSENWNGLLDEINEEVLNDAFKQYAFVRRLFSNIGPLIERPCKTMARIEKKRPIEREKGKYFPVLCDFMSIRVNCKVSEIEEKIDRIKETVLHNGGKMYVRGTSDQLPYGFFMGRERVYTDITQYVYIFLPKVGYPVEFQIGHEFASYAFTVSSAIRDGVGAGKADLWRENFYEDVKRHILDQANGSRSSVTRETIEDKAYRIHEDNIPADLQGILNRIWGKNLPTESKTD